MRLIGAGLPRTATLTQKVALEMLGVGPCYHMVNVLGELDLAASWQRALDGDADWSEIFDGFASTVDWPGSYFYRELIDTYPDAKVLLSVRDGDSWERSMRKTIWAVFNGDSLIRHMSRAREHVDPKWRAYTEMMEAMWDRSGLIPGGERAEPGSLADAMRRYNDEVQETVPGDRLLVWQPGDGWEPLCKFLELPIPETPFPHLNDSESFAERIIDGSLLAVQEWRRREAPVAAAG